MSTGSSSKSDPPPSPLSISTANLPNGTTTVSYSANLAASGGTTPYSWSVAAGSLPAGLSLSTSSGTISGKPTTAGQSSFTIRVSDSSSPKQTASRAYTVSIAISSAALSITTSSLPNGQVNTAYNAMLSATGGVTPYTWYVASGALPTGVSLANSTGTLSGTPSASGTFDVTLGVQGGNGSFTTSKFSITIAAAALVITTAALPNGVEGSPYDAAVLVSGGTPPYTWSLTSGSLPSSVALGGTTGSISGTPTTAGTFAQTVQVTDSGKQAVAKPFTFTISSSTGVPPQFSSLKSCTVVTPWPSETLSGDCSAHASPADSEPAVYNGTAATVYTDPVFGTKIKRLTPQPGMPSGSYGSKYAPYQSWSKHGTYLILTGPGGNGYLFKGTDPYTFIRKVSFPSFDGWDEPQWFWSNTNDCLLLYVNSNKIQTINVCNNDAVTTLTTFTSLTDKQGHTLPLSSNVLLKPYIYCHQSDDDTKIGMVATGPGGTQGFGLFSMNFGARTASNTWFHIITAGGDLPETGAPQNRLPSSACVSPGGNYVMVSWNTYNAGRVQNLSSLVRNGNVVTATSSGSGWPSGVVTGATVTIDSVNSDTSFNGTFALTSVSGNTATYNQTGSNSSLTGLNTGSCTVNGSTSYKCDGELDYQYYGFQQFDAATGNLGPEIDRSESHSDQMVLADGSDALLSGGGSLIHNDNRRYMAYKYGTSAYDASNTSSPYANFYFAQEPDSVNTNGETFVYHVSGEGSNSPNGLPGWALISTYASTTAVDCNPQLVYCAEIMVVKMDGSNTFYRIAHSQSIQNQNGSENYYAEPHATPSRDFTHIIWESNWRNGAGSVDTFLVELPAQ